MRNNFRSRCAQFHSLELGAPADENRRRLGTTYIEMLIATPGRLGYRLLYR